MRALQCDVAAQRLIVSIADRNNNINNNIRNSNNSKNESIVALAPFDVVVVRVSCDLARSQYRVAAPQLTLLAIRAPTTTTTTTTTSASSTAGRASMRSAVSTTSGARLAAVELRQSTATTTTTTTTNKTRRRATTLRHVSVYALLRDTHRLGTLPRVVVEQVAPPATTTTTTTARGVGRSLAYRRWRGDNGDAQSAFERGVAAQAQQLIDDDGGLVDVQPRAIGERFKGAISELEDEMSATRQQRFNAIKSNRVHKQKEREKRAAGGGSSH